MSVKYPKFLLFGDSITEWSYTDGGFGQKISEVYARRYDIICRGFGGYNSDHATLILPEILKDDKFQIMTIFFGTNDAFSTFQGVPLERYSENIDYLVKLALKDNIKVVVISPALHDPTLFLEASGEKEPIGSVGTNQKYAAAAKKVANDNDVGFVDLFTSFQNSGLSVKDLLWDGIHFTPNAYKLLFEELMKSIREKYPEEDPKTMAPSLTYWNQLADCQGDLEKMKKKLFHLD
ncbi:isoamyl acetate-hydrolyzing esterase [[Candida] railenensis]|uniref:Isoamyl acetate-hydrolyzing esterase n=1 Tax=[Candida] railenensis TaxID=45579 RepID=A0A9P0VWX1_9ASCO|nr:isoamyl acetate-hydrolyzing esterase [[Candida] railenensis]